MASFSTFVQNNPTPAPQEGLLKKTGSFLKSAAIGLGKPFYKAGAMVGNAALGSADAFGLLPPQASANLKNAQQNGLTNTPFGKVDVPTVDVSQSPFSSQNAKAIKSSIGEGVNLGAMLGGAEIAPGEGIVQGAIQGAKSGAIVGGGQGFGQSLENNAGLGQTLVNTGTGAVVGAGMGLTIGGITGGFSQSGDLNAEHPIFQSNYDQNVAQATQANNQAGMEAANSIHEASNVQSDVRTGLGNQFAEAPNIISKADPSARGVLPHYFVDLLNKLKDTAGFKLPDWVRTTSPEFGSTDVADIAKDGVPYTPQQGQDLATRLNDLTFKAKASGELKINQQSIDLTNQLKDMNQNSFGHVTDAQGNSVWNQAYQQYRQGIDAMDSMSKLIPTKNSPGEMLDPTEVNDSVNKMIKMTETPQGRATLMTANEQYKNATGYDILNDPMGSMQKLIDSSEELQTAIKGNYMRQLGQAIKNPNKVGGRLLYMTSAILGIAALGTAFRKQLGSLITGQ